MYVLILTSPLHISACVTDFLSGLIKSLFFHFLMQLVSRALAGVGYA